MSQESRKYRKFSDDSDKVLPIMRSLSPGVQAFYEEYVAGTDYAKLASALADAGMLSDKILLTIIKASRSVGNIQATSVPIIENIFPLWHSPLSSKFKELFVNNLFTAEVAIFITHFISAQKSHIQLIAILTSMLDVILHLHKKINYPLTSDTLMPFIRNESITILQLNQFIGLIEWLDKSLSQKDREQFLLILQTIPITACFTLENEIKDTVTMLSVKSNDITSIISIIKKSAYLRTFLAAAQELKQVSAIFNHEHKLRLFTYCETLEDTMMAIAALKQQNKDSYDLPKVIKLLLLYPEQSLTLLRMLNCRISHDMLTHSEDTCALKINTSFMNVVNRILLYHATGKLDASSLAEILASADFNHAIGSDDVYQRLGKREGGLLYLTPKPEAPLLSPISASSVYTMP
jgi:hypothetical protein